MSVRKPQKRIEDFNLVEQHYACAVSSKVKVTVLPLILLILKSLEKL